MNYIAHVSAPPGTNQILPYQDGVVACARRQGKMTASYLNSMNEQGMTFPAPQYSGPAVTLYEALLATAAATSTQQAFSFQQPKVSTTEASPYAATLPARVLVKVGDNNVITQQHRSEAASAPPHVETNHWQPAVAYAAGTNCNNFWISASPAGYPAALHPSEAAPGHDKGNSCYLKSEVSQRLGNNMGPFSTLAAAPAGEMESVMPAALNCYNHVNGVTKIRPDAVGDADNSVVRSPYTRALNGSRTVHSANAIETSRANRADQHNRGAGDSCCDAPCAATSALDLHGMAVNPLAASNQDNVLVERGACWPASRLIAADAEQVEKQSASGEVIQRSRRLSAASTECLPPAQHPGCANIKGSSPANRSQVCENQCELVLPRQSRRRSSLSTWCWDTGKYPYPDTCTPRMWSDKSFAFPKPACEPPVDHACNLRNLRCVSPTGFARIASPAFPYRATCSKIDLAGCGLASPTRSVGVDRGYRGFHQPCGSATDWFATVSGRNLPSPFSSLTLEEAASDGLCNPHHELQNLADVLREEECSPVFVPRTLLTNEAPDRWNSQWHDVVIPASDGRSTSASLPEVVAYSGTHGQRGTQRNSSDSKSHLAATTLPPYTCSPMVTVPAEAPKMTLPRYQVVSPLFTDGTNNESAPVCAPTLESTSNMDTTASTTAVNPAAGRASLTGKFAAPAVTVPISTIFTKELGSTQDERTAPNSLYRTNTSTHIPQEAVAQPCQLHANQRLHATPAGQSTSFDAEITGEKNSRATGVPVSPGLHSKACPDAQIFPEHSGVCLPAKDLLRQAASPSDSIIASSASSLDHAALMPTSGKPSSNIFATPSAPCNRTQEEDHASTWHSTAVADNYAPPTDSSISHSYSSTFPPLTESCHVHKCESIDSAKGFGKDNSANVHDTGEGPAREGPDGLSTEVSTAPLLRGSGLCAASPLPPPQGGLAAGATTTTNATPGESASAQSPPVKHPSLDQGAFCFAPPNASCCRGHLGASHETCYCTCVPERAFAARSAESAESTTTTMDPRDKPSPDSGTSACDNSRTPGTNTAVACSVTAAPTTSEGEERMLSSKQALLCHATKRGGLPGAPLEPERRPHIKNKLDRLELSALPSASFLDSSQSEDGAVPFIHHGSAAGGGCSSRPASESVPTPTTAGHSSQSPLEFSPLSSEGEATAGNGTVLLGLGVHSTQQDFFCATSSDGSRETPCSINVTALQFDEFFSGKEADTRVSDSGAPQVTSPLSLMDPAEAAAGPNAVGLQCVVPALRSPSDTANGSGTLKSSNRHLSLSTDDWISNVSPSTASKEMMVVVRQETSSTDIGGQATLAAKPAAEPVSAEERTKILYQGEPQPNAPTNHPESFSRPASHAAHCVAPQGESSERVPQDNKQETPKYVLAGTESDVSHCTQFNDPLVQQHVSASFVPKDLTQTYQQWWFSNGGSLQCGQQQNAGHNLQDGGLPGELSEYSISDSGLRSASSGGSYAGAGGRNEAATKYVQTCGTGGAIVEKLQPAANVSTNGCYATEEDLIEYEEQWDAQQGTAFVLADAGPTAVPVRTRKGFRKPLPLPQEMLASPGEPGDNEKGNEPVLQYDVASREWRVFWVEDRLARYKVFQAKKFGKERAQQLAEEWYRRARAGDVSGSGRGLRTGVRGHVHPKSKKLKVELQ